MFRRATTGLTFLLLGLLSQLVFELYGIAPVSKLATTFYMIAGFALLAWIIREMTSRFISSLRRRYTLRKATSILTLVLVILATVNIWVADPQALLVAFGLVAAGIAVALQDIFKNFAGGVVILVTGMYRVGNRVEVDGVQGDVIDTGIFYTTLLEVGNWVSGDQSTGRIVSIPNGKELSGSVDNYTRDHHFLWDEISIPITHQSDMKRAVAVLQEVADKYTDIFSEEAGESLTHMERRYYLTERDMESTVFTELTDNWILLTVRYVVEVRERRQVASDITRDLINRLQQEDDIEIASETIDVVDPTGGGGSLQGD